MKYRKKPVIIDAMQLNVGEKSMASIHHFTHGSAQPGRGGSMYIPTLDGAVTIQIGDWVVKEVNGGFDICKPDIFEKTYEKVEE